jgi:hypothetical protein
LDDFYQKGKRMNLQKRENSLELKEKKTLEEIASEIVKSWESLYPDFEPEQFENLINEMKNLIEKGKE